MGRRKQDRIGAFRLARREIPPKLACGKLTDLSQPRTRLYANCDASETTRTPRDCGRIAWSWPWGAVSEELLHAARQPSSGSGRNGSVGRLRTYLGRMSMEGTSSCDALWIQYHRRHEWRQLWAWDSQWITSQYSGWRFF